MTVGAVQPEANQAMAAVVTAQPQMMAAVLLIMVVSAVVQRVAIGTVAWQRMVVITERSEQTFQWEYQ